MRLKMVTPYCNILRHGRNSARLLFNDSTTLFWLCTSIRWGVFLTASASLSGPTLGLAAASPMFVMFLLLK
eukprot:scaffold676983_cov60-Prasinocladus_malaysianus.AAC.1